MTTLTKRQGGKRPNSGQPKKNLLGYAQIQVPKEVKIRLQKLKKPNESWHNLLLRLASLVEVNQ
jgi:hypothetical protein